MSIKEIKTFHRKAFFATFHGSTNLLEKYGNYPFIIIGWEGLGSAGGLLRVGTWSGAKWVGYQESGNSLRLRPSRKGGV